MTETIEYDLGEDGIALVRINTPDSPVNIINPAFLKDFLGVLEKIEEDAATRGVIITSAKSDFMAGGDLNYLLDLMQQELPMQELLMASSQLSRLFRRLETCGKPVAAAINGTALGGGLELALACHYRIAADRDRLELGCPEVRLGLLPGAGGTQRLPRLTGLRTAMQMLTQGRSVSAQQALESGFIDAIVEPEALLDKARVWILEDGNSTQAWDGERFRFPGGNGLRNTKVQETLTAANALTAKATQHNYPAPQAILSCVYEGSVLPIERALNVESRYFAQLLAGPVARNMVRTLFVNRKAAERLRYRPQPFAERPVRKIGVLGAGMMGAGIASVSAQAGMDVVLIDRSVEDAARGKEGIRRSLDKRVQKGRMSPQAAEQSLNRIMATVDYDELRESDLVVEAVFEDRAIKADVTGQAEARLAPEAIFASNTSTLPISGLARASARPPNFIGLHFFSPVERMPLVEVIIGEQTSRQCIAWAMDYVSQIRKAPILVNDSRGFFTSRVFATFTNEGMALLDEGVRPALIENAARQAGMAVGPLAVVDEVTIALAHQIDLQTQEDLGDEYEAPSAIDVVRRMHLALKRSGRRFGAGFYEYPDNGRKFLWPGLGVHFPVNQHQPDVEEVKKRLLYIQALETARCLEEGVLTTPVDGDIGSVFGWAFPAWSGGALSLIDMIGAAKFVEQCDRFAREFGSRFAAPERLRQMAASGERYYASAVTPSRPGSA